MWLIDIDNYDLYKNNKFIYEEVLEERAYHICINKHIKSIHINLDYLKRVYYNKVEISDKEKMFLIFILNNKDTINSITNDPRIESVTKKMEVLKNKDGFVIKHTMKKNLIDKYKQKLKKVN